MSDTALYMAHWLEEIEHARRLRGIPVPEKSGGTFVIKLDDGSFIEGHVDSYVLSKGRICFVGPVNATGVPKTS